MGNTRSAISQCHVFLFVTYLDRPKIKLYEHVQVFYFVL